MLCTSVSGSHGSRYTPHRAGPQFAADSAGDVAAAAAPVRAAYGWIGIADLRDLSSPSARLAAGSVAVGAAVGDAAAVASPVAPTVAVGASAATQAAA